MTTLPETATRWFILSLTPLERLEAATNLAGGDLLRQRWFIASGLVTIAVLGVLFFIVTYRRKSQDYRASEAAFYASAQKRGLNSDECKILREIAERAGLSQYETIFTMDKAFNVGASLIIEEALLRKPGRQSANLRRNIAFLRQKLGFQERTSYAMKMKKLSSRQIPVGKKLHITRRLNPDRQSTDLECTLIRNNEMELVIRLPLRVETEPGEFWRVYYHLGASVWEFDSTVVDYNGFELSLSHSDEIRYINRRRFLRVPVRKQGFIGKFPFQKIHRKSVKKIDIPPVDRTSFGEVADWGLPKFVPAIITELAGPGLRVEADIDVKVGDRVLVAFKIDETPVRNKSGIKQEQLVDVKLFEELGHVRHIQQAGEGISIAVELAVATDAAVNELIRATNAEAVRAHAEHQDQIEHDAAESEVVHASGGSDV